MLAIERYCQRTARIQGLNSASHHNELQVIEQEHAIESSNNNPALQLSAQQQRRVNSIPDPNERRKRHFQFICLLRDRILLKRKARKLEARNKRYALANWASDEELRLLRNAQWAVEEAEPHNRYHVKWKRGMAIIAEEMTIDFLKKHTSVVIDQDEAIVAESPHESANGLAPRPAHGAVHGSEQKQVVSTDDSKKATRAAKKKRRRALYKAKLRRNRNKAMQILARSLNVY
ncbi:hypothetical protein LTR08_007867 [Meristemomyces frigidus]|nr:hypothetical protein LTR08_007867 [Meristemomyces frigidus]